MRSRSNFHGRGHGKKLVTAFDAQLLLFGIVAAVLFAALPNAWAKDLRITFPRHSQLTPVQHLNREGVNAIRKHQYEKAEAIFYKAYLYDATDPFTLNNLGYVSELQGNLVRAQKFYAMALKQNCDATIALSNTKQLEGQPMTYAVSHVKSLPMRVNHMNVEAIDLLSQNRNLEADRLLRQALALDPNDPFTLNNLGVAAEASGDFDSALKYYGEAASSHSSEPIVVTFKRSWRGKPISEVAEDSAQKLANRLKNMDTAETRATLLTFRGVSATNQNDWPAAKQDFLQAYSLNPASAFSLNNLGYVAEKDGDLETAQFYYSKAQKSEDASTRIGLATNSSAEGRKLVSVARESDLGVGTRIDQYSKAARQQTGPVQLIPRGGSLSTPAKPNKEPSNTAPPVSPHDSQIPN